MRAGWVSERLGDICTLLNGRAYKKEELLSSGKYPVLRVGNFFTNRNWYYSDLELDENKYCDKGDLLYAWSASFGPRIWKGEKVIFHYHIWKTVLDTNRVDKKFLYYWFDWDAEKIKSEQGAGTTMIHVTKGSMESRLLALPTLPEQKRIVAILDEAFEGIDAAIANTQQNLSSARELFESYLNDVFARKGEGWVEKKLIEITTKIGSGATPRGGASSYKTEGISLIRSLNVYDRRFSESKLAFIDDEQANKLSNVVVEEGDVLFNITGASVARCCIVPKELLPARVNQHVSILRPESTCITANFFCLLMTSYPYKKLLLGIGEEGGSTRQAITKGQLQELLVSFPPEVETQENIVSILYEQAEMSESLESNYQQKLESLNELKQSLLAKAFSGELTAKHEKVGGEAVG